MNKVVLKEFERKHLVFDIALYLIYVVTGFVLLNFSEMGLTNPIKYSPYIFYMFAFFCEVAYFANRRKDDYELLLLGFINVVTATFILIYMAYPDSGFILADAVLLYSIANVLNKGYSCNRLIDKKDFNFFPKVSVTILLLFLGVFVVASLYSKIEVGVLILGYYFIIYGLLSLLEPFNEILLKNKKFENYLLDLLSYERDDGKISEVKEEAHKEIKEEKKEEVKEEKATPVVEEKPVKKSTTRKTVKKTTTKKATKAPAKTITKKTTKKPTTKKSTTKKTTKKTSK